MVEEAFWSEAEEEKSDLEIIGEAYGIDTNDWFGKYLALGQVLADMGNVEAEETMKDFLSVLEDQVRDTAQSV